MTMIDEFDKRNSKKGSGQKQDPAEKISVSDSSRI